MPPKHDARQGDTFLKGRYKASLGLGPANSVKNTREEFRKGTALGDFDEIPSEYLRNRKIASELMHYLHPTLVPDSVAYGIQKWQLQIAPNKAVNAYVPLYVSALAAHLDEPPSTLLDKVRRQQVNRVQYKDMKTGTGISDDAWNKMVTGAKFKTTGGSKRKRRSSDGVDS